jgi:hypothetical protein
MTSPRKIQANRANAGASTGPKTGPGRARAARNALRHGLSLSVFADPTQSEQVETLAREITGEPTGDDIYELARRVAEAQIDLQRVRYARHQFLADRRARPQKVANDGHFLPRDKFATILLQEAAQLQALDRYERRALSRRRFAIRALDRARGQAARRNIVAFIYLT